MKKLLTGLLLLATLVPSIKAQDYIFDNPDNSSYWGVRLGFDVVSLQSPSNFYNNRGGIEIGAIYNLPLWKNLFFEPGASLFYNSAGINGIVEQLGQEIIVSPSGTLNNWGIRIPLNFGYHFDVTDVIQIVPFTGPQFNINFANSQSYNGPGFWSNSGPSLQTNGMDFGWGFGVGVKYLKYYIGISGTVGITRYVTYNPDAYKTQYNPDPAQMSHDFGPYPLQARRNLFQITLGYNF